MLRIRFDGPPGPTAPRFVETEDGQGYDVLAGHWEADPKSSDWFLVLEGEDRPMAVADVTLWPFPGGGYHTGIIMVESDIMPHSDIPIEVTATFHARKKEAEA